jgi:ubiquinone/menaquinone biosynthesis C-methylase UbiE
MSSTAPSAARVAEKQERLAKVFDTDVWPLYGRRFAELLLRDLHPRPGTAVLEIGCATGELTLELARRLDEASQITALELSAPLATRAQAKISATPRTRRRVTIVQTATPLHPTLVLPDSTFDICVSNLGLADAPEPQRTVAELANMLKPGGELWLTVPLRGTWGELLDIYRDILRDVLRDTRRTEALAALDAYVAAFPDGDTCARWLEEAGLENVEITVDRWEVLFGSAREFFFAPLIQLGPLSRWKQIAGRGDEMQDIFFFVKQAIDTYFEGRIFSVTIAGGCVRGRKKVATP